MTITDGHTDIRNYGAAELRSRKAVAREMGGSKQALGRLMEQLRSSLEYGYSMGRVWLEHLSVRRERTLGTSGANSRSEGSGLRVLRYAAMIVLMMVGGVGEMWGQPFTVTTDTDNSGSIDESEKHYYLIQGAQVPTFYCLPASDGTKVSTTNVPSENMLWYFLDAGTDNNIQYYYIIHKSGKYLYKKNDSDGGIELTTTAGTTDVYKFRIEEVEATDYYFIRVKGSSKYVNKKSGNVATNPLKNSDASDNNSQWQFIALEDLSWEFPFTFSTNETKAYYKINHKANTSFYISLNDTKVCTSNATGDDNMVWYFEQVPTEKGSNNYITYCYIINAVTGKYMCFDGAVQNDSQDDVCNVQNKTNENEEKCQFIVVRAAKTGGKNNTEVIECYAIIPRLLQDKIWNNHCIGKKDNNVGTGVYTKTDRNNNDSHWTFESIEPCDNPTITFDETTEKVIISTTTTGASIYYTTTGENPTRDSTPYNNGITLTPNTSTTIKAVAVKNGNARSNVVSKTVIYMPTITLTGGPYTYDGNAHTPISSVAVGGEPLESNSYNVIYKKEGVVVSECKDVGEYTIELTAAEGVNDIIYASTTFTINPKEVGLNWTNTSLTYNGVAQTPVVTVTNLISPDACTVSTLSVSANEGSSLTGDNAINAGSYTATASALSNTNYKLPETKTTTFTIAKAPLTITANDNTITYGDDPAGSVEYSGFVNEETASVLGGSLVITGYSQYGDVGTYTITPDGLTSDNYEITFAPGTLTVTQKEVGLTWGNTALNYDGSERVPTVTATGLVNDDEIGVTVEGGQTDIGTGYTATATALTGDKAGNYKLPAENTIEFSIQTPTLTITANSYTIHYGDPRPNYAVTYEGFVNGDDASVLSGKLTYTCDYVKGEDVGTYTITPKGLRSDKYEITFVAGTLTVEQKEVGLSWGTTELIYTGTAQMPTATATGLVNDDEIGVTVTVTGDHTNVGTSYTATATALTGTKKDNYTLPAVNTTSFSIVKAPLTVTANDKTITYGDEPANDDVTYIGFVNGETSSVLGGALSYAYDYNQYDDVVRYNENDEVVPYTITPNGLTSDNYDITFETGTLTVNQKEVTLTWDESSFPCDGSAHAPTPTINNSDIVNSDDVSGVTVTIEANSGSSLTGNQAIQAGYYRAIATLEGTKAGNYKPVPAIQPFTISFKMIGDGIDPAEGIAIVATDGSNVTVTDGGTPLVLNTHYTVVTETEGCDNYITVTGKGNYSGAARVLYVAPIFHQPSGDTEYAAVYRATSDLAKPADIDPYIVKKVNPSVGILTISPVGYLPEGVPVVLVAASNITGFQATAKPDNVAEITAQTKNSNLLKISPEEGVEVEARQIYLFNAGEFVLTLSGTLPKGYFYLDNPNYHATGTTPGGSSRLQLVFEDDTETGIENSQLSTLNCQQTPGTPSMGGSSMASRPRRDCTL